MLLDEAMLAQLRKTQESSMHHVCSIEPYIVAEDGTCSYGEPTESVCGFQLTSGGLSEGVGYDTIAASGKLRLPIGTPIGMGDRVKILTAFGRELDPVRTFKVTALPASFGPSGQVIDLEEVFL